MNHPCNPLYRAVHSHSNVWLPRVRRRARNKRIVKALINTLSIGAVVFAAGLVILYVALFSVAAVWAFYGQPTMLNLMMFSLLFFVLSVRS